MTRTRRFSSFSEDFRKKSAHPHPIPGALLECSRRLPPAEKSSSHVASPQATAVTTKALGVRHDGGRAGRDVFSLVAAAGGCAAPGHRWGGVWVREAAGVPTSEPDVQP